MKKLSMREMARRYEEFLKLPDEPPTLLEASEISSGISVSKKIADEDELNVEYEVFFTKNYTLLNEFEFNSLIEFLQDIRDKQFTKHLDI